MSDSKKISIIIPTYDEKENIEKLIKKIFDLRIKNLDVIVIDDNSLDGTGEIVDQLSKTLPIQVIHRTGKLGLSSAVIEGYKKSYAEIIIIMDADFSHDYKIIPQMIRVIGQENYDMAIGSRYIKGGGIKNWPFKRKLASLTATWIAKIFLGIKVKDPMSGFFAVKREVFGRIVDKLKPRGYKILLEMLVRAKPLKIKEIPYTFKDREFGQSKFDSKIVKEYLKMVWELRKIKG